MRKSGKTGAGPETAGRDGLPVRQETGARATGSLYLRVSVFLAGAGVMSAEMAAPRLLAPFFGTTQFVWTNIIGTVLAALTLGAFVGGRLADRWPTERTYARAMALGGALLAVAPIVSRPLLKVASSALAAQSAATFLLSLAAVCLFFAPPVFVLGMISPWAVRLAGAGRSDLGRVAGVLSGLGAAGSIFGTFFSSLVLLPLLGTRNTLLATAGLLIATGAWRAFDRRRLRVAGLVVAAGLAFLPGRRIKAEPDQIYEAESFHQYIQVRRSRSGRTRLFLNEGIGTHSIKPARGHLTGGYYDSMNVLAVMATRPALQQAPPSTVRPTGGPAEGGWTHRAAAVGDAARDSRAVGARGHRARLRVLVLGLAAGTMAWQLDHYYGRTHELEIDGVEIDPGVIEAGRRFFDLDTVKSLRIHVADARPFLGSVRGPYDLIIADAFKQPYIPFHMVTREFYQTVRERLAPGGVFAINLGADPRAAELIDAFTATMRSAFPHVRRFVTVVRVKRKAVFHNYIYVGSKKGLSLPPSRELPVELRGVLHRMARTWAEPEADARAFVFTDDRAPIEFFIHRMVIQAVLGG